MATIVVGGRGKNAGKTSLICGILSALPEFAWSAVKVTDHAHGKTESIWEEIRAGQGSDTARFLSAGARHAFLLTAETAELPERLRELGSKVELNADLIFESNRIVDLIQADVVLALREMGERAYKSSFERIARVSHAEVALANLDRVISGAMPLFKLARLEHISPQMECWLRHHLPSRGSVSSGEGEEN